MKQVTIKVLANNDVALRDTNTRDTYLAERFEAGEFITHECGRTDRITESWAPVYRFKDDAGDTVTAISYMSGRHIVEEGSTVESTVRYIDSVLGGTLVTVRILPNSDTALRDCEEGKEYKAKRFGEGEYIPEIDEEVGEGPSYVFIDDVGDSVQTLPSMSGRFLEEVEAH